jgi:pSer/pThr/pTyr-binding forkhead associated (FHA) protein
MANPHLEFTIEGAATRPKLELGDGEASIGRSSECSLVLPSGSVSRRHARVVRQGPNYAIEDLGSSNGTFVNGERTEGLRVLKDQDEVKLGSIVGRFVKPPEPAVDATVAFGSDVAATLMAPPKAPPPSAPPKPETLPPTRSLPSSAAMTHTSGTATTQMSPSEPEPESPTAKTSPPTPTAPAGRAASDAGRGPGFIELVAIAVGSFLVVFGIGAALIRFLF